MAQMLDNAKQKGGYHIYGSAKRIDELKKKEESGKELTDDEKKYLKNRRNQNLGNEETGGVENTGGGDPISSGDEFLVASNTEEADLMRDKTNGDIPVRVQQDRNEDGTFATDDRNEGKKSNIGKSNLYRMTAPKSRDEWRMLAKKDPQKFAATVELYLQRLEISASREDFYDLSKKVDNKAGAKIRKIAIENNKKNLQKIRDLVAKSGNEKALGKVDKSLRNHNEAVLKKMGFDPSEILGNDVEENDTLSNDIPEANNQYSKEEIENARATIFEKIKNIPGAKPENIKDEYIINWLNSNKK